jgi:hypothetical protein
LDCSESPLDRRLCSGHAMAGACMLFLL